MSKFSQILSDFQIDESLTKSVKKDKSFNHVKDNIPLVPNYNYMADLLFLPTNKQGYRYCLVVVDLATNNFDIEPMKNKEPATVLAAFKSMFKRPYIKKPYASIRTDSGNEFKGVFQKYLYDQSILHKVGKAGRHKQLANVESLNRQLGRIFNGYLNKKEEATGKVYREWTDIVPQVRTKLNAYRAVKYKDTPVTHNYSIPNFKTKPKFKVGDIVYIKLDEPENALGKKVHGRFREGDYRFDTIPRKIVKVFYYSGNPTYRYQVSGITNASFSESEMRKAKEEEEEYEIREIIDKKKIGNKIMYKVWWRGYPKAEATWVSRANVLKNAPQILQDYEDSL